MLKNWEAKANYNGGGIPRFIGVRNYLNAFASSTFRQSLFVTVKFVVVTVTIQLLLAFAMAVMLNDNLLIHRFFRSIFFIPAILSTIAVSMSFMLIFNVKQGWVNQFLQSVGLPPMTFLNSPDTALETIMFVAIWQNFGYFMVIFLAGLQTISPSLYESADLDGANSFQKLFRITIPMLTSTTFFCVIISIIRAFQVFDQVYVMTGGQHGGGPRGSTSVLVFRIYQDAFTHFRMGYAASQATILLIIVLSITIYQYRSQSKWVNYDLA